MRTEELMEALKVVARAASSTTHNRPFKLVVVVDESEAAVHDADLAVAHDQLGDSYVIKDRWGLVS